MGIAECLVKPSEITDESVAARSSKEEKRSAQRSGQPQASVTARYKAEFPDGEVPFRHVYQPACAADVEPPKGLGTSPLRRRFLAWATAVIGVADTLEQTTSAPTEVLEFAREQFVNLTNAAARKKHVVTMMRGGLTLRQIARYTERPLTDVAGALFPELDPETLADASDRVHHDYFDVVVERTGLERDVVGQILKWAEPLSRVSKRCDSCGVPLPLEEPRPGAPRLRCGARGCAADRRAA